MRRVGVILAWAAFFLGGCGNDSQPSGLDAQLSTLNPSVREAVYRICKLERMAASEHSARVIDVRGMSARAFKRVLLDFPGQDVHVWMPGEKDWLLVGNLSTNRVPLAKVMEAFASDANCTMSVPEVFASYVGTREDVLPAFRSDLKGDVMPEWFVTEDVPALGWLNVSGVDADIAGPTLREIRSMQVVRRELLRGNMFLNDQSSCQTPRTSRPAHEDRAKETWARAALRNPRDPMLLERLENLNRNAKGFLEVGKLLQAMKCYETIVLIQPKNAAAVHNFGICLKKIGKLDLAEQVLRRAKTLTERGER